MMILMTIVMKIEHGCMHHDVDLPARTQGLEEAVYKPAESKKGLISPKKLYLDKIFGKLEKFFFYIFIFHDVKKLIDECFIKRSCI